MSPALRLYLDFVVFIFGAALGSFANVCIYRMPRNESIVFPPSHCGACGKPVAWYDNIPLVSYLVLRGHCRLCGAKFSCRYWFVEFLTAALWLTVWFCYRSTGQWGLILAYWLLLLLLIIGTFIDFEFYIIPNEVTLGSVVAGLGLSILWPALHQTDSRVMAGLQAVIGALAGGLILLAIAEIGKLAFGRLQLPLLPGTPVLIDANQLKVGDETTAWDELFNRASDRIRCHAATLRFQDKTFIDVAVAISETDLEIQSEKFPLTATGPITITSDLIIVPREAMGMGDVKLLAGIGAFLGWQLVCLTLFLASVAGGLVSLVLLALHKKDWQSRIPFGPYLALGALICLCVGHQLVGWYLHLFRP